MAHARPIRIREFVRKAPDAVFFGADEGLIRLNHNETSGLIPPHLLKSIFLNSAMPGTYPAYKKLHRAIARSAGVPEEWVQTVNGSDDAIPKLVRMLFEGTKRVVLPVPTFPTYERALKLERVPIRFVPYTVSGNAFAFPTDAVIREIKNGKTQGVLLCNPGNPLGVGIPHKELTEIARAAHTKGVPLVVDEAYVDFNGVSAIPLLKRFPNIVILRTFSKTYGLAGVRLGYVIARPDVVAAFQKLILPWEVNHAAVRAGLACLAEKPYFMRQLKRTVAKRDRMMRLFTKAGVEVFASRANFIVCKTPRMSALLTALKKQGIVVKSMGPAASHMPFLRTCFRISIPGPDIEKRAFIALTRALSDFVR